MHTIHKKIMYRTYKKKKDDSHQLVLRVTINRKIKLYPIGIDVKSAHFDKKKQLVKRSDTDYHRKNMAIKNMLDKASNIQTYFFRFDIEPTLDDFDRMMKLKGRNTDSVFEYIDHQTEARQNELTDSTIKFYQKQKAKLKAFRDNVSLGDIDRTFVKDYQRYLIQERGNNENTWNKSLEFLRRILNAALKDDLISKTPFSHIPIKNVKGSIDYLSLNEVALLEKEYKEGALQPAQQNVLRYFLFACYTGMRYGDIKELRYENLVKNNGSFWIYFTQQKTKKDTQIPLIPQAVALLPGKKFKKQQVFRVVPNQTTNRHLKEIIKKVNIDKRITFHSARHTCSNLLYRLGVPIEIRSLIVGDTIEVVRDRYTKADQEMILTAMTGFGNSLTK